MKYGLPSPLSMLEGTPPSDETWKSLVVTKITVWFEQELRQQAINNSKMEYFNVQLLGLSGRPHPALHNINTTQECKKLRHHIKFLTGDVLTGTRIAKDQPGSNPACKLCLAPKMLIRMCINLPRKTVYIASNCFIYRQRKTALDII